MKTGRVRSPGAVRQQMTERKWLEVEKLRTERFWQNERTSYFGAITRAWFQGWPRSPYGSTDQHLHGSNDNQEGK